MFAGFKIGSETFYFVKIGFCTCLVLFIISTLHIYVDNNLITIYNKMILNGCL